MPWLVPALIDALLARCTDEVDVVVPRVNGFVEPLLAAYRGFIGPLARAAMENALQRGQAALTGPVARGDAAAVAAHLEALNDVDPELARAYGADARRTAQRAHAPEEVFAVLDDWTRPAGPHPQGPTA